MCLTDEDPHAPHRHLCVPAEVVPFLIILVPQSLQTGFDIPTSFQRQLFSWKRLSELGCQGETLHTFVPIWELVGNNFKA